ncbi:MAG: hypothetical protein ACOYLP_09655 [Flavobacterium sp.]|uniref:hypothetical protein n=1 Tax=Flavobacterium sp. TaxID=239 RepID=UPI003BDD89A6
MKIQIIVLFMMLSTSRVGFSQSQDGKITTLESSGIRLSETNYHPTYTKTLGSPYPNKAFLHAKVGDVVQNALLRYNACYDEFEFINSKNDTLVLNNAAAFSTITITYPKALYQYVNFTEKSGKLNTGYLVSLFEKNGYLLYKRQKIKYYDAIPAKSSYDTSTQARFVPLKDTFFIKINDGEIFELPTNKKELLKLFPEKKTDIEIFIKQNEIDLEKEPDVIKLIEFFTVN